MAQSAFARLRLLVVGGGVAGLSFAARANALGAAVTLAEKRAAPESGGYVVGVYQNGLEALRRLGLDSKAKARGWLPQAQNLTDGKGRVLRRTPLAALHAQHNGAALLFFARADLLRLLGEGQTQANRVLLGAELTELKQTPAGVEARFANGEGGVFDAVAAADGIDSAARRLAFANIAANAIKTHNATFYYTAAGVGGLPPQAQSQLAKADTEALGHRAFLGLYPIAANQCGMYAAVYGKPANAPPPQARALRQHFAGFEGLPRLFLEALPDDAPVYGGRLREANFRGWRRGAIFLIGDAAHAMPPTTGQGVSLAMEDGLLLAELLAERPPAQWGAAFDSLEARRAPRLAAIRRGARLRNAVVAHCPPALCGARDFAIRALLGRNKARGLAAFFKRRALPKGDGQ